MWGQIWGAAWALVTAFRRAELTGGEIAVVPGRAVVWAAEARPVLAHIDGRATSTVVEGRAVVAVVEGRSTICEVV